MNNVAYFELQAYSPEKLITFYETVFGWTFTKDERMPLPYWRITTEGMNGGLFPRPNDRPPTDVGVNGYCCSMQVEDYDATAKLILNNGGIISLDKFAIPGKCWQGYYVDTDLNVFGIFQVDEHAA